MCLGEHFHLLQTMWRHSALAVRECRELEERFQWTDYIYIDHHCWLLNLTKVATIIIKQMEPKSALNKKDVALQLKLAYEYSDLCMISMSVGWRRLWDNVLNHAWSFCH